MNMHFNPDGLAKLLIYGFFFIVALMLMPLVLRGIFFSIKSMGEVLSSVKGSSMIGKFILAICAGIALGCLIRLCRKI